MTYPIPKAFHDPAHKLSGRIIKYLLENWHQEAILYSINVPMIQGLLEGDGLKIYWTGVWKNHFGRLFKESKVLSATPEVKKDILQGTDPSGTTEVLVKEGTDTGELAFRFSPSLDGILSAEAAPQGSDAWALSEGAVSVTVLLPGFAELHGEQPRTVTDRLWKMKL